LGFSLGQWITAKVGSDWTGIFGMPGNRPTLKELFSMNQFQRNQDIRYKAYHILFDISSIAQ
jgi:hypothetical protein